MRTLKDVTLLEGIGLVSGEKIKVRIKPAEGIFIESQGRLTEVSPGTARVGFRNLCIGSVIYTEHLLSALFGLGIDGAVVEVDSHEIPLFDGSSLEICKAILRAGMCERAGKERVINVIKKFEIGKYKAEPSDTFKVKVILSDPRLKRRYEAYFEDGMSYIEEIAPARTYGFIEDIEKIPKMLKARSFGSAIILKDGVPLNGNLRFKEEFAKHKILDLMGDLFVLGRVKGRIEVENPAHASNLKFIAEGLRQKVFST